MAVTRPGTRKPPNPHHEDAGAFSYPDHITLSPGAERYLERLAVDLGLGVVDLDQLPSSLMQLYVLAFEAGRASLQPELDRVNRDADRLYAEVCRRPPSRDQQTVDEFLAAQKHRGADAAEKRAAEIRAYIDNLHTQETE